MQGMSLSLLFVESHYDHHQSLMHSITHMQPTSARDHGHVLFYLTALLSGLLQCLYFHANRFCFVFHSSYLPKHALLHQWLMTPSLKLLGCISSPLVIVLSSFFAHQLRVFMPCNSHLNQPLFLSCSNGMPFVKSRFDNRDLYMHWKFIASEQVSMAFQPLAKFIYHNVRLTGQQTKSITFERNFLQCIYTLCNLVSLHTV